MRIRGKAAGGAALACLLVLLVTVAPTPAEAISAHPLWHGNNHLLTEGHLPGSSLPFVAEGEMYLNSTAGIEFGCDVEEEGRVFNEAGRGRGEVTSFSAFDCSAPAFTGSCSGPITVGQPNLCVWTTLLTTEMPLEEKMREAVACKKADTALSKCPLASEREARNAISSLDRGRSSLPWKLELASGEREEQPSYLQRTGLHEYGEAGSAVEANTACYPKDGTRAASYLAVPTGCIALNVVLPEVPLEMVLYGSREVDLINGAGNGLDASKLEFLESGTLFSSQNAEGTGSLGGVLKMFGASSLQLIFAR